MTGYSGFTMVPNEVIYADITPQAKALFMALSSYTSAETGIVWPSRRTLAGMLGMKQAKSVDKYIEELEAEGFIRREYRPNQSARYEVVRWSSEGPISRFTRSGAPLQGIGGGTPQGIPLYPTGDRAVPHRGYEQDPLSKPTNQTQSLTICETTDLGKCDLDSLDAFARRAAGQCEETIDASIYEEHDGGESSTPTPVDAEAKTKDAGDGEGQKIQDSLDTEPAIDHAVEEPIILELPVSNVDTESLIATAPDDLSEHEEAALRAAKFGWDPYGKTWVDLSTWG